MSYAPILPIVRLHLKKNTMQMWSTIMGHNQGGLDTRHQRYLSSQHFYTPVALRNSETTSWSKVEGVGFHKKARKVAVGFINYLQIAPATASDTSTTLQPWTVGLMDNCELGGSSCDSSIMCQCVDL